MDKSVFDEFSSHLINDIKPSKYFNRLIKTEKIRNSKLKIIFKLKEIQQNPKYHPEGDVWEHTMMVIDEASKLKEKSKNPKALMWAALLHDIGKITTTKIRKGRITSYEHDFVGAKLVEDILNNLVKEEFIKEVAILVKYHMHTFYINKNLPFAKLEDLKKEANINELILLSLSDRLGRGELTQDDKKETYKFIDEFKNKVKML